MRFRRIIASILDILVILLIFSAVLSFIPLNNTIRTKYNEIGKIEEKITDYRNLSEEERNKIMDINYEAEHEMVKYYLIMSVVIIIYFIFIPKYRKDQTIGQHLLKVRLVSDGEITFNTYIVRALLNSTLSIMIFFPIFLYIFNAIWYSNVTGIFILIQFVYWIISFFMLIIKGETIHDKITKTRIIEVKR